MLTLGFAIPLLLFFGVAFALALRDAARAFAPSAAGGFPGRLIALGEVLILAGSLAVIGQGRVAGLVMTGAAGFVFLFGGAFLLFAGWIAER